MKPFTSLLLIASPTLIHGRDASVFTPQGIYHPLTTHPLLDQYLSIPYALPPLGPLRFSPPQPYTSSPSIHKNATSRGPSCLSYPSTASPNGQSEDCLTLDITRPSLTATNASNTTLPLPLPLLPVLVFIHGGAHTTGQTNWYPATPLLTHSIATQKPYIHVQLNYRLGGFGWLYNTRFAEQGLLNLGLKDQRLALRWVRDNIHAFRGDGRRIVVMGQSSGSFDTWMVMRGDRVLGEELVRGAIAMSGAPGSLALKAHYPADGDLYFRQTLVAVGCANCTDEVECLRGVSADELSRAWFEKSSPVFETLDVLVQQPIGFAIDGELLTTPHYWTEEVASIPLISGTALNEGSIYALNVPNVTGRNFLLAAVAKILGTTNLALAATVVDTYYNHTLAENGRGFNASTSLSPAYYRGEAVLGDAVMDIPRRVLLATHSKVAPTWGYKFSQQPPLSVFNSSWYYDFDTLSPVVKAGLGATHASDLPYVFGNVIENDDAGEGDAQVSTLMMDTWLNFVHQLDPNPRQGNASTWERYDPRRARLFVFERQGPLFPGMRPDELRLDSYDAYRTAIERSGIPALPEIKV